MRWGVLSLGNPIQPSIITFLHGLLSRARRESTRTTSKYKAMKNTSKDRRVGKNEKRASNSSRIFSMLEKGSTLHTLMPRTQQHRQPRRDLALPIGNATPQKENARISTGSSSDSSTVSKLEKGDSSTLLPRSSAKKVRSTELFQLLSFRCFRKNSSAPHRLTGRAAAVLSFTDLDQAATTATTAATTTTTTATRTSSCCSTSGTNSSIILDVPYSAPCIPEGDNRRRLIDQGRQILRKAQQKSRGAAFVPTKSRAARASPPPPPPPGSTNKRA
jgi:hypothetical protein